MKKKKNLLAQQEILLALLHFWWPRASGQRLMRRLKDSIQFQITQAQWPCPKIGASMLANRQLDSQK